MFWRLVLITLSAIVVNETNCKIPDINYPDISDIFIKSFEQNATTSEETDEKCASQMINFIKALNYGEMWAIEVFDSWGKFPSGILSGNLYSFGNFDQCLAISHNKNALESADSSDTSDYDFNGQYCLSNLMIDGNSSILNNLTKQNWPIGMLLASRQNLGGSLTDSKWSQFIGIGICFPQTCTPKFLTKKINDALAFITPLLLKTDTKFLNVSITDTMCQSTTNLDYGPMDIFAICLFTLIGVLMTSSTVYDLKTKGNKSQNSYFTAFSINTNGAKLFKCKNIQSPDVIECLNGIRALTIIWVVYCHSYGTFMDTMFNLNRLFTWMHNPHSMIVVAATVAVDTFFLLSGLLVTFKMLNHFDLTKGKLNVPLLYLHRYLRLTPVFAAAILFYSTIFRHLASGPLWKANDPQLKCSKHWWASLLYIQNYFHPENMCIGSTWYLMIDMQLYILSPLIVYSLWRWRNKFALSIPILIVANMVGVFTIFITNDYVVGVPGKDDDNYVKSYIPTHARYGAWCVGVLLGYILHQSKSKEIQLKNIFVISGWTASIFIMISIILGYYPMNQYNIIVPYIWHALYDGTSRVLWATSIGWIIFACVHGFSGPINSFLSLRHWQPISRLSYCIFVLHEIVLRIQSGAMKSSTYFNEYNAIHEFWGNFGIILSVSILWTMAFEMPILALEKLLLNVKKPAVIDQSKSADELPEI